MIVQLDIFRPIFNGSDYEPKHDDKRLIKQFDIIFNLMKDGQFRTLQEIKEITGYPESSISAQLRHMRKPKFGGHYIFKRSRGQRENGLFEYQLVLNK